MWILFVLAGAALIVLGFTSTAASSMTPIAQVFGVAMMGAGVLVLMAAVFAWYLERIERRLQDLAMLIAGQARPSEPGILDEYRMNRLKGAVERTWRQGA